MTNQPPRPSHRARLVGLVLAVLAAGAVFSFWPDTSEAPPPRLLAKRAAPAPSEPARAASSPVPADAPAPAAPPPTESPSQRPEVDEASSGVVATGHGAYRHVYKILVEDPAHRPISGAAIARAYPSVEEPPRCTTDGAGVCEFSVIESCKACGVQFRVTSPGHARLEKELADGPSTVELRPERRLTVHLDAPGSRLLSSLSLDVEAKDGSAEVRVKVDSAGTTVIDQLPEGPLEVRLVDQLRPLATQLAAAGVDELTFHLEPRRVDVQIEFGRAVAQNDLCKVVDLRCGGQPRLLANLLALGSKALQARFEYAPAGPCKVALSKDCSGSIETGEWTELTPPTAVTIHAP